MSTLDELIVKLRMDIEKTPAEGRFKKVIDEIQKFYAENLNLKMEEVAIFLANKDKSILSFACPEYLVNSGMIPVSSTDAIVSTIFRTGRSVIINGFNQQKHLSVFEVIPTPDKTISPIWKMIGCVIATREDRFGVIELSRRGPSIEEAGEDFSQSNLEFLRLSVDKLAPVIKQVMPEDFRGMLT